MLVLALDTSTRAGSAALIEDDRVLREEPGEQSRPQVERLPVELMGVLERGGRRLAEVDVFAVVTGPGSFTGLRIGIAAMQGLAFAAGRPLVGVSAFDGLARLAPSGHSRVETWIDAWRGEVYAASFDRGCAVGEPTVAAPERLLEQVDHQTVFLGDGARTFRALIEGRLGERGRVPDDPVPLLAGVVGRLAIERVQRGSRPAPGAIRPLYVRRPDAELAREAGGAR